MSRTSLVWVVECGAFEKAENATYVIKITGTASHFNMMMNAMERNSKKYLRWLFRNEKSVNLSAKKRRGLNMR